MGSNVYHYLIGGLEDTERWKPDMDTFSGCTFLAFLTIAVEK
jgi:hypothetical protein